MNHFIEPLDPAADADTYCYFCGKDVVEDCTCPECKVCQVVGDPDCLLHHEYGPLVLDTVRAKTIRDALKVDTRPVKWDPLSEVFRNADGHEISQATVAAEETVETTLKLYMWSIDPGSSPRFEFALAGDSDEARDMIAADGREYLRKYLGIRYKVAKLDTPFAFFITCDG